MDVETVTARLLTSLCNSGNNSVRDLLRAFGITNTTKTTLPLVFDTRFDAEWRTFLDNTNLAAPDHETKMLYTVLEFIRYMRHNRRNPFLRKVQDPATRLPINPDKVYRRLVAEQMEQLLVQIDRKTKSYSLFSHFSRKASEVFVEVSGNSYNVTSYTVLRPRRPKDNLDSVLPRLRSTLYSGEPPIQLLEKFKPKSTKSALPSYKALMVPNPQNWGWLVLHKKDRITLALRRSAGGYLVFRSQATFSTHINLGSSELPYKFVARTWKALKTAERL